MSETETPTAEGPVYAGFWKRVVASIVDGIVVNVPVGIVYYLVAPDVFGGAEGQAQVGTGTLIVLLLIGVGAWIVYKGALEGSEGGATIGKRLLSIKVTNMAGGAPGFVTAVYRAWPYWAPTAATVLGASIGSILSSALGLVGLISCIMVAFTAKKQGLHDMMAKCLVVRTG